MPIYEYRCQKCGHVFDKFVRGTSSVSEVECPECHSRDCRKNISVFGTLGASSTNSAGACAPTGG